MFQGILLTQNADRSTVAMVANIQDADLPEGEVLVEVSHSSLNYKDALAISGRSPVVRKFPMVPGIDFAGSVLESSDTRFKPGDRVLLTGWGVGESHWGGLAQRARVSADWLVSIPAGMDERQCMSVGTAGFTAMLCIEALERHGVTPQGDILVTGAGGGVGGFAVSLLARLGYRVTAVTGRVTEAERLTRLGASEILSRDAFSVPGKPLAKERWTAVVDCVGSHTLVNACASTRYGGAVAACGLAQGMDFPGSVAPFILRGVSLLGVDSVMFPSAKRPAVWQRIAATVDRDLLDDMADVISLQSSIAAAHDILAGQVSGRKVVDVKAT